MIANFYRVVRCDYKHAKLIASKNLECIPERETFIMLSGQLFVIDRVYLNLDKCEYNFYIVRA